MRAFLFSIWITAGAAMAQNGALSLTRITPVVGMGSAQSARLSVLNPGTGAPLLGVRCNGTIAFVSDQGLPLKSADVTVDPGKAASLELTTEAFAGRVQFYALIITPPLGGSGSNCTLIPTIEIIDNFTGNTVAVLSQSSLRPPVPAAAQIRVPEAQEPK